MVRVVIIVVSADAVELTARRRLQEPTTERVALEIGQDEARLPQPISRHVKNVAVALLR